MRFQIRPADLPQFFAELAVFKRNKISRRKLKISGRIKNNVFHGNNLLFTSASLDVWLTDSLQD